jgi:hypothetical protein
MGSAPALSDIFATIPDPRGASGRRYPLPALLNLIAVATMAGMRSLEGIAQFARDHGVALTHALGFRSGRTPCKATLSNLLRRLDVRAYEEALSAWVVARCPDFGDQVCLDGKTARGSRDGRLPGAHLLAAYAPQVAGVIGQIRVDAKTNEHKAALVLLGVLPIEGKVISGDAMFCQKDVCQKIIDRSAHYIFTVKDNQPTLHFDIAAMFHHSAAFPPLPAEGLGF